jgi:sulfur carrier protein ThiS
MAAVEIRVFFRGLPSEAEEGAEELAVTLPAGTMVAGLLEKLAAESKGRALLVLDRERRTLRPEFLLTLNGRFLEKGRFDSAVLGEGDSVEVFPIPSGG